MDIIDKYFKTEYDAVDTTASSDGTPTTSGNQTFADISLLNSGSWDYPSCGTMEHNLFTLDGSKDYFSDLTDIAFFNNAMSNSNGEFTTNPTITVTFTTNHSSAGLTLYFADDYPVTVNVKWYTLGNTLLYGSDYSVTSNVLQIVHSVANYGKIVIEIKKCLPYRYVKLQKLMYGITIIWDETSVISGTLVEELDMVSDKLSINTLKFTVLDMLDKFNLGNSEGLHTIVQKNQKIRPYEVINGVENYLGAYYVVDFSVDNNSVTFNNSDAIGVLDSKQFYKGDIYNGVSAGTIITAIMTAAGLTSSDYEVDAVTSAQLVYGTIKVGTCRNALREVLFAVQSQVDTGRSDKISIFKQTRGIQNNITKSRKISTKITKKDNVTGVKLNYYTYSVSTEQSEIISGTYSTGSNLIIFDTPYTSITTNVGTITESGKYYCVLTLDSESEVTISGYSYTESSMSFGKNLDTTNIKEYTSYLSGYQNANSIVDNLLQYHKNLLQIDTQFLAENEKVKDWNKVENVNEELSSFIAGFESMSTDLTGGFVTTAKLSGYYDTADSYYFTGTELYGNDNFIL